MSHFWIQAATDSGVFLLVWSSIQLFLRQVRRRECNFLAEMKLERNTRLARELEGSTLGRYTTRWMLEGSKVDWLDLSPRTWFWYVGELHGPDLLAGAYISSGSDDAIVDEVLYVGHLNFEIVALDASVNVRKKP